jgi:DNA (cytosine-5)-methyltransferase 1
MNAVDLFAGAGGWSLGFADATGHEPILAVNHCAHAVRLHALNHPTTQHFLEDVRAVDPRAAAAGRKIDWLHLSPDCTHFSRAKGGKPRDKNIRALAWVGVDWAAATRPRILSLENVSEFETWGPLLPNGQPDKARAGETFREFVQALRRLAYEVEWRVLCAADYGAPTIRRRLFLLARCDGQAIRWPVPTHQSRMLFARGALWKTASDCIDWSRPCPSIYDRKKPLAAATLRRIDEGCAKYGRPKGVQHFITSYYSQGGNSSSIFAPLPAVVTKARHALVQYGPTDIGMRMLTPRELARAQGFPDSYILEGSTRDQIARIGNSVCPPLAAAIVRANT